jgi:predicted DsbA family dithiol-disulfide isomerase
MTEATQPLHIDFVADIICPWCYLGWRKLQIALEQRPEIVPEIAWIPFQLAPERAPEGGDRRALMKERLPEPGALEASDAKFKKLGAEIGIAMNSEKILISPNTNAAHRLILWAGSIGKQKEAIERVLIAYWTEGKNIGDHLVLADIGGEIGLDSAMVLEKLAAGTDAEAVTQYHQMASRAGINGVPCTIFGRKVASMGAESPEHLVQAIDKALAA